MERVSAYDFAMLEPRLTVCDIVVRTTAQTGNLTVSRQPVKNSLGLMILTDFKFRAGGGTWWSSVCPIGLFS